MKTKTSGKCTKCGNTDILTEIRIVDRGDQNAPHDLQAVTYDKPQAIIFKGAHYLTIKAWICKSCGYTELYSTPK